MKPFAHFGGMVWPLPGDHSDPSLEWVFRYGKPTGADLLRAASIVSAYRELIQCPEKKRRTVVRELRKAMRAKSGEGASHAD